MQLGLGITKSLPAVTINQQPRNQFILVPTEHVPDLLAKVAAAYFQFLSGLHIQNLG